MVVNLEVCLPPLAWSPKPFSTLRTLGLSFPAPEVCQGPRDRDNDGVTSRPHLRPPADTPRGHWMNLCRRPKACIGRAGKASKMWF